jgi:hypothetical protein
LREAFARTLSFAIAVQRDWLIVISPDCGQSSSRLNTPVIKLSREAPTGAAGCSGTCQRLSVFESFKTENRPNVLARNVHNEKEDA